MILISVAEEIKDQLVCIVVVPTCQFFDQIVQSDARDAFVANFFERFDHVFDVLRQEWRRLVGLVGLLVLLGDGVDHDQVLLVLKSKDSPDENNFMSAMSLCVLATSKGFT